MKIHAIQTGSVRIHKAQQEGQGHGVIRLLNMLFDGNWTDSCPIYAWVIEHADGLIVVDTGESGQASRPGYYPHWHPYYRLAMRLYIRPEDEIGTQLSKLGILPKDVRTVVMTHLHTDHAGGLHYFSESEILVAKGEFQRARGIKGSLNGYLNNRWPSWFKPSLINMKQEPIGAFAEHLKVTKAGDVIIVPTPGHTPDHVSVVVRDGSEVMFLAGDATYTQSQLLRQRVDGISPNETVARETLHKIMSFVFQQPTVYLPTHDPKSGRRLANKEVIKAQAK
jgi:N-acyl homoserine lactone hydrolase